MGFIWSQLRGVLVLTGYFFNTVFWVIPILALSVIKLLPLKVARTASTYLLDHCASAWISVNVFMEQLFHPVRIKLSGDTDFNIHEWYMVIANHQSWVDILVLQRLLNHKVPFLKFFLKKELIYVPLLGLAWWALDFPFMRRYTTAQLKKNPRLKGKDIEITRRACAKFKTKPVSVMNFVEGTRFRTDKHKRQNSPYKHLLRPKAGGMAFALSAMDGHIHKLLDVTLYYPGKVPSFWDYACGRVDEVAVHIKISEISPQMRGDYLNDRDFKLSFQEELCRIWQEKDQLLEQMASHSQQAKG
jgi:1-acyl-sn-glycerol-3-phosphate acyltransferase